MSLELKYNKEGKIYSFLGEKYKVATPEEIIRQKFVCVLVNNYKYDLAQMQEEVKTKHGKGSTRADIVIWQNIKDKQDSKTPLIVIECKADNIRIKQEDYEQGESYARLVNAPFFVTHNSYETRFWRVKKDKMPGYTQEIVNIPKNKDDEKAIKKLLDDLVEFKEDEFAKILHECHNYIRNIDKLAPSEAFDEISKILFMKVYIERIAKEALSRTKQDFNYPIFMAEAESVGITSRGETGENVPNDFIDKYEKSKNELGEEVEILSQKGIATHFKDFLKEQNIAWSKADERT